MLLPPAAIGGAILACLGFPILLLALSHGPLRIAPPGRRFLVAWAILAVGWLVAVALAGAGNASPADLLAGLMVFGAAILCSFMVWSVLCWGFTLNMLLALPEAGAAGSAGEWERAYAGPAGLLRLADDRAGVLLRSGLAVLTAGGSQLELTPRGRFVARAASLASRLLARPS